ncbi:MULTISPECIES: cytochrome c biogenesis CcdA family protein [unclassified Crossiella]|uniref:cytochrome c biogenesis CcdA family protein n=1 Tax=unclassified Crossiella TaxID=2620835 RepID=UPI001FFEEA83|nr:MULTISPECIES: cytochrome c biogenesis CcdA family protein [unclassified Crossiella]MCK2241778.1 cytochrome c biogenesis CcdA family protein [Crossiella sp. S99.2]MCK2255350.1 cytochrome c biogenesis CcdA family protein [Crossiella sp. S99.1]
MTDIGLLGALFGGVLSLVSPCSALLLPSFFAYAFDRTAALLGRTAVFYAGLALVLVPLGAGVGAIGSLVTRYRDTVTLVGGIVLVVLGVITILGKGFAVGAAQRAAARIRISSTASVFALGAVYGLAGFCAGPLLGAVLTVSAAGGDPVYGGLLMAVYAFGMAAPLFLLALLWDRFDLGNRGWLRGRTITIGSWSTHSTSLLSGALFIGIGVLFLLTDGTANLGGLADVDSQFSLQVWLSGISARVPDLLLVLPVAVLVLAVLWRRIRAR